MSSSHRFGGKWTEEKLEGLRRYLPEYMKIMSQNPRAAYFNTIYVDAFAGTGYRTKEAVFAEQDITIEDTAQIYTDPDTQSLQKGSAVVALEVEPPFDRYIFIDANEDHVQGLTSLREQYTHLRDRIEFHHSDANVFLQRWCAETDWRKHRAVLFLDPYGMQVEWRTIEAVASTKAIDMFVLFPLGQAVNRLLTRDHVPNDAYSATLTKFFGTDEWMSAFYTPSQQPSLFESEPAMTKQANFESIAKFFVKRLETLFPRGVAQQPKRLYNSRNVPLFLLCFAAGNPKGAPIAVKIAQHVLDM